MSTKRLQKTVIEGGRGTRNKWERRHSHDTERTSERDYLSKVALDPEGFDDDDYSIKEKDKVYKEFSDNLGPVNRWLAHQVGRSWDEVRSEVATTFDTRTTAGRHIVYCHLLSQVSTGPDYKYGQKYDPDETTSSFRYDFYVDTNGILRQKTYIPRKQKIEKFDTVKIANWLSGRVVGKVGNKLFWFTPVGKNQKHRGGSASKEWKCEWGNYTKPENYRLYYYYPPRGIQWVYLQQVPVYKTDSLGHRILGEENEPIVVSSKEEWQISSRPTLRQDRKLNEKELAFWNTIPEYYQTKVLEHSPTYPNPPKQEYYTRYPYYY